MVLDIATAVGVRNRRIDKLAKDVAWFLVQNVSEHVQTAAVGHSQHDFFDAVFGGFLDGDVH